VGQAGLVNLMTDAFALSAKAQAGRDPS